MANAYDPVDGPDGYGDESGHGNGRQGRIVATLLQSNKNKNKNNDEEEEEEEVEEEEWSYWKCLKITCASKNGKNRYTKPHDAKKEGDLLGRLDHGNIIEFIDYTYLEDRAEHHLITPLYAFSLKQLLSTPLPWSLSHPHAQAHGIASVSNSNSNGDGDGDGMLRWLRISTDISHSLLSALHYLHTHQPPIGHRDVNPSNVLFDWKGILKLADFGTAYAREQLTLVGLADRKEKDGLTPPPLSEKKNNSQDWNVDLDGDEYGWNELPEEMCYDVGTGPYRAPELLFSPGIYDPLAIDLWAAGSTLSQLFIGNYEDDYEQVSSTGTPCSSSSSSSGDLRVAGRRNAADDEFDPLEDDALIDEHEEHQHQHRLKGRKPLFDDTFGSLGLAASIFRIRGTATYERWPSFSCLPDAGKIDFPPSDPVPLEDLLPFLTKHSTPSTSSSSASLEDKVRPHIISMINDLLALDPSQRISAKRALESQWFEDIVPCTAREGEERIELMRPWLEDAKFRYAYMLDRL